MKKFELKEGKIVAVNEGKLEFDKSNRAMSGYPTLQRDENIDGKEFIWTVGYDSNEKTPWTFETMDMEYEPDQDPKSFKTIKDVVAYMNKLKIKITAKDFEPFLEVM